MDQTLDIYTRPSLGSSVTEGSVSYRYENLIEKVQVDKKELLKVELSHFIEHASSGKKPSIDGVEGMRNIEIAYRVSDMLSGKVDAHKK